MTRRERLMRTLRGEAVDRPPVCLYELNGLDQYPCDPDPFNIFSDPSWRPLLQLCIERTDRIVLRSVPFLDAPPDPVAALTTTTEETVDGSRHTTQTIRAGRRQLTARWRRDRDIDTCWTLEHPLKDTDDLRAWLELPQAEFGGRPDPTGVLDAEKRLGNAGIVGLDTPDPLCCVAPLFEMGQYTIIAMTEQKLFHRALERAAALLLPRVEAIAAALPGRLWRIYGPEYASPPYLPPRLFREYVTAYVTPMVDVIQRHGGYARLHSHGRLRDILDDIAATGCCGLDPIEPPPQGDVSLADVRERYGEQLVLFGNLEISDIENLPTAQLEPRVITALREGTAGRGRGFVLMPSASPYGRQLAPLTVSNYTRIVALAEAFTG